MLKIGSYNTLVVERQVEFGFYLNPKEHEVLLPAKYAPPGLKPGDTITVFVYADSEDRPVATTQQPHAVVGDFASLMVKDVTPIGAFVDWGLEKDLLIPLSEQQERMKDGKRYVVKVCFDSKTDRVFGTTKISDHCEKDPSELKPGKKVSLLIHSRSPLGFLALIDGRFSGLLYKNEIFENLQVGDAREGYVSQIREDNKIDLTLKRPGISSIGGSGKVVLDALEKSDGFIPCHDKSTPERIKTAFSMSKKEFKRAIGMLYKRGLIQISEDGITLKEEEEE